MSQQSQTTLERENSDLCAVLATCQSAQDVDERLSTGIRQYVLEGSFDLLDVLIEAADAAEKPEVMERVLALVKDETSICDIPEDENGPAMRGTLMAIPLRAKPAILTSLESQVPTPATALTFDAAAVIVSQLPLHPHRSGDAFYVALPRLLAGEDLRELTFEQARKMTVSMKDAFFDARAKSKGFQPGQQVGISVKTDVDGAEGREATEGDSTSEAFTTVEDIPRTLFLVYLQVEMPGTEPLAVTDLDESERIDFGLAVTKWDGMTRNLLRAAFRRELEFHLDELPGPFFETVAERDVFEWCCLVHETLGNQLALTRGKAANARVFVDFNRVPCDGVLDIFEAEIFLTDKNERVLGSLYFPLNPGETPEDVIGGVGEVVTTLGISEYYPPSRAWWHKEEPVEATEYTRVSLGPNPEGQVENDGNTAYVGV